MWKLSLPACDNVEAELATALTYANGVKKYSYSESQKTRLLATYAKYDESKGQPRKELHAARLGPRFLAALRDAFAEVQEGKRLASLRSRLKLAALKCPYCGFGEVSDLDHQLPRSIYKALSIYPRNLIPSCHVCNNKKRAIAGAVADEQFFHVYLDELPEGTFFVAKAAVSEAGLRIRFRVRQTANMSGDLFRRLQFLVERLELNNRYQAEVIAFVTNHRTAIEQMVVLGPDRLREFLQQCSIDSTRDYGPNHWRTAVWTCLAESDAFCHGGYRHCFGITQIGA